MKNKSEHAKNADLWEKLLELCEKHEVEFEWVKGHAGIPENERCDQMAMRAASQKNLKPDEVYEKAVKFWSPIRDIGPEDRAAVIGLIEVLDDKNESAREQAVEALMKINTPEAQKALEELKKKTIKIHQR